MGYNIKKDIISGLPSIPLNATKIIVAHEAGNANNTGPNSLKNEIAYMKNNHDVAFTSHWVGNGGEIVQTAPTGKVQWGAGHVANKIAYAHVEMARTDNEATFEKDYKAYIWLLRHLANEAGLPITLDSSSQKGIKSHDWVTKNLGGTTHTDPYGYFRKFGISKAQFKKDVEKGEASKPSKDKASKDHSTGTGDGYRQVNGSWTGQTLQRGQKGQPVRDMQQMLSNENPPFYPNKGAKNNGIDGFYGPNTENQVERYQEYHGLGIDGMAGPEVYGHVTKGKKSSSSGRKQVKLPASAGTWGTYKLNVQPVKKNISWYLTPAKFGGLTYDILDEPYPHVYTIKTGRGKRNIYAGPATSATVTK